MNLVYIVIALLAFAGNSILGRMAMDDYQMDPQAFTVIRLVSGALVLSGLVARLNMHQPPQHNRWLPAVALFVYAVSFSYAYQQLDAGVGALILFGAVQMTMVTYSIIKQEALTAKKLMGVLCAFAGLAYLLIPASNPTSSNITILGFMVMTLSGISWGAYTLLGRHSQNPLHNTTSSFTKAAILSLLLLIPVVLQAKAMSTQGITLAVLSGAITSGLGYAVWYKVLPSLSSLQASVVQLLVPVIATLGGIIWLNEALTVKLLVSMLITLTGILLVFYSTEKKTTERS